MRRVKWVAMGIFAPELVVFVAWWQWNQARKLTKKMTEVLEKVATSRFCESHIELISPQAAKSDGQVVSQWTMEHSFFALMGGYAVECKDYVDQGLRPLCTPWRWSYNRTDRHTLTSTAVLRLAQQQPSLLPHLSLESIQDRSKADRFTKILACIQAGYIFAQVVGRVTNNLPITMLEVNTISHVLCAFIIYSFWLKKPFAVENAIHVGGRGRDIILALSFMEHGTFYTAKISDSVIGRSDSNSKGQAILESMAMAYPEILEQWNKPGQSYSQITEDSTSGAREICLDRASRRHSKQNLVWNEGMNTLTTHAPPTDTSHTTNMQMPPAGSLKSAQTTSFFNHLPSTQEQCSWNPSDRILIVWNYGDVSLSIKEIKNLLSASEFWSRYGMKVYRTGLERPDDLGYSTGVGQPILTPQLKDLGDGPYVEVPAVAPLFQSHAVRFRNSRPVLHLQASDLIGWDICWRAMKVREWRDLTADGGAEILQWRSRNWPQQQVRGESTSFPSAIMFATAIYGGLHALCWHAHFPSHFERLLWRMSALVIAGSGFAVSLCMTAWSSLRTKGDGDGSRVERIVKRSRSLLNVFGTEFVDNLEVLVTLFAVPIFLIALALYCAARAFIVVEAFISLRSLPADAYKTPNWTAWLPHL